MVPTVANLAFHFMMSVAMHATHVTASPCMRKMADNSERKWKNTYLVLRHGESESNVKRLVVSHPDNGVNHYGLTEVGKKQAVEAAERLRSIVSSFGKSLGDVLMLTSDFMRTRETADIIHKELGLSNGVKVEVGLRERFFGKCELQSTADYSAVWDNDATDPANPKHEGETVFEVYARTTQVISTLEKDFSDKVCVLVSHGDTAQILSTHFMGLAPEKHRQLGNLGNCSIRNLSDQSGGLMQQLRMVQNNRYYAVRHGQALSNVQGVLVSDIKDGGDKFGLTELGREQAQRAAEELKEILIADEGGYSPEDVLVVTSPLLRTKETAELIHQGLGCKAEVQEDHRLIERQFRELNMKKVDEYLEAMWSADQKDMHKPIHDIEGVLDITRRMVELLKALEQKYNSKVIVLVSHGDPIFKVKLLYQGLPVNHLPHRGAVPNCSITPFRFN